MDRKFTWLVGTLTLVLIAAPALVAQTTWVLSGDNNDKDDGNKSDSSYMFFGTDDSAFLGVTMEEETEHEEGGARINSVVDGSPAEKAGLQEGDIVVGFGKDTIRGPVGLTKRIRGLEPGDEIEITVLRDGRKRRFDVELGERSSYSQSWANVAPRVLGQLQNLEVPEFEFDMEGLEDQLAQLGELGELGQLRKLNNYSFFDNEKWQDKMSELSFQCEDGECDYGNLFFSPGRARLGVQLTETTPELREHLGGSADAGVLVSKVVQGSAAEDAGVEVGDLIVEVGGDQVSNTSDLRKALAQREGDVFDIEVIRNGRSLNLSVTLETEKDDRPTGPRAYRRIPHPTAPAIVRPDVAPRLVPRVAPMIRERIRVSHDVVQVDAVAPELPPLPDVPAPPRPVFPERLKDDVF